MRHPETGIQVGPVPALKPMLKSWLSLQRNYLRALASADVTWIYGERASLSVLAAAAWHCGGVALEEFSTDKKSVTEGSELPVDTSAYGRCDLFLKVNKQEFLIEAKPCWPGLRGRARTPLKTALRNATDDARRTSTYRGARRLGAVFIAPHVPKSFVCDSNVLVQRFLADLHTFSDCTIAWYFPRSARQFIAVDGRCYPGAAILLKPLRAV